MKRYLIKHVGNMGDMVFFIPPVLETLKRREPDCHITFVTAWGFKKRRRKWKIGPKQDIWGERNQGGFCISLMMTNPHIDQLVHWHSSALALDGSICQEEGTHFPTWNRAYFEQQRKSGHYDGVHELDFGIGHEDNPITRMYGALGMPEETFSNYKLYFTDKDKAVAAEVMKERSRPRIVILEGLEGQSTRGWDPGKIPALEATIEQTYGVKPTWFGGKFIPTYQGRPLTLRENIATLLHCDAAIGVLSGPLHFAAAVGLPTLTLYCDQVMERTAPAYFLNRYITDKAKWHRTLLGPSGTPSTFLKNDYPAPSLTPAEAATQGGSDWQRPGRQSTKTCLAVITPEEIMTVLTKMVTAD